MSTPPSQQNDFLAARAESCRLLGLNPDDLSPHEMIRCDLLTVLRLWLDGSQSALLSGGTADPVKILAVADVLGKLVPEPEHKSRGEDPREIMWQTYKQMRDRGAAFGQGYDGLVLKVKALEAELAIKDARIAELEATLAGSVPLPPNAVKLRDNPGRACAAAPAAPPKPELPPPAAASAPVLGELVMVVDASPQEPWRDYIEPTGEIRSTPFGGGKYWGPV
jgi:hypothetical protein